MRTAKNGAVAQPNNKKQAMALDLDAIRSQFPSLSESDDGSPRIYFDNPAGTQVPRSVTERMSECMLGASANLGGYFRTSKLAGQIVADAQVAMAQFLNALSPDEIVFGQNMTSITFHVSRSIGRRLSAGDEIVLSRMDHDANIEPWVLMARDHGLEVRWLPFDDRTYEIEMAALDEILSDRTRLVCVCGASNLTGTINDIAAICSKAGDVGAWTYIDAVQSAPHVVTDVQAIGCDFLVCSAYKFFGPHQGILWGSREVLEQLEPYKVRPAPDSIPWCFAPGTASHEGMAGTTAALDYLAWIGTSMAGAPADRKPAMRAATEMLFAYEQELSKHLVAGLQSLPGVTIRGITAIERMPWRVPTVSFTHATIPPDDIAAALAERNIFVWSGHNYAVEAAAALGILESGGAVRIGPVHYNRVEEIDTLLEALQSIIG
jgi:cysteine desulfurase family protein (TIGR01976 family)